MPTNPWIGLLPLMGTMLIAVILIPAVLLAIARRILLAKLAPAIERLRARMPIETEMPPFPLFRPELLFTHRGCRGRIVFLDRKRGGFERSPWTALRVALPIPAPSDFQLVPKDRLTDFVAKATGVRGLPTRDAAFDERFVVVAADPRAVQPLLGQALRASVLDLAGPSFAPPVRVEVERKVVLVRAASILVAPEALDTFVVRALRVFDHVHDQLAGPILPAQRPPPPPSPREGRSLPLA